MLPGEPVRPGQGADRGLARGADRSGALQRRRSSLHPALHLPERLRAPDAILILHRAGPGRGERAVAGEEPVGHDKEASWNLRRAYSSAPNAAASKAPADFPGRHRPMTVVLGRAFAMRFAAPAAATAYPRISASAGTA